MCTVTIFKGSQNDFILTSNRDEAPDRITLPPKVYSEENGILLYPKDSRAGGTWIGLSSKNRLVCVLNGAFKKHRRQLPYLMSRGQVAKELLLSDNLLKTFQELDLRDVEPFTMIVADWNENLEVYEWVWDSRKKHLDRVEESKRMWSSSSLYDPEMKQARRNWFSEFLSGSELQADSIWEFHHSAGKEHSEYGVIMDRGHVRTTSVTQVIKTGPELGMRYEDLQTGDVTRVPFQIPELNND